MNQQQIADLSAELIMKYYGNDYMPFLEAMDDDALWYGPAEGQFLHGREKMIEVWNAEDHSLSFSLGNIEVTHTSAHPSFCDVMLSYHVTTHYPDYHDITLYQRLLLTWCERTVTDEAGNREKISRILLCHISNPHSKHEEDTIYPKNFHQIYYSNPSFRQNGDRIHFHGLDRSDYFFLSDTVVYIEAAHESRHSILHTVDGEAVEEAFRVPERPERRFCGHDVEVLEHPLRAAREIEVVGIFDFDDAGRPIALASGDGCDGTLERPFTKGRIGGIGFDALSGGDVEIVPPAVGENEGVGLGAGYVEVQFHLGSVLLSLFFCT